MHPDKAQGSHFVSLAVASSCSKLCDSQALEKALRERGIAARKVGK